jgi:hypothetical protein
MKRKRPLPPGPADAPAIRRLLIKGQPTLAPAVRDRILSAAASAVPTLIEVLVDESLAAENGPGQGYAPIHAARLLGDLAATEAIEPLLGRLADTTWGEILHDTIIQALPRIGATVVEPALRLLAETDDPDVRHSVRAVLSEVGVRDDRIRDALVAELELEPDLGAMHLSSYGDASVLPLLHDAFSRYVIVRGEMFGNQALIEIEAAIEELGGTLTPAEKDKLERAMKARASARTEPDVDIEDAPVDGTPVHAAEKVGRNEPCWCGSGRKYKKCHLAADEERNATLQQDAPEPDPLDLVD